MDLQQIRYFLVLAKELHFWNTSRKVSITQSALSRQIKALEEELGVELFERNKRNVKLTNAGVFLENRWTKVMDDLLCAHQFALKIHKGETGEIRIAHPGSIISSLLPGLLSRISGHFPELKVQLMELMYDNMEDYLQDYKIDLAFSRDIKRKENISSYKVLTDHFSFVVPVDHPMKQLKDITSVLLRKQKFILPPADHRSSYLEALDQICKSYAFEPSVLYESDFGTTVISLVEKGLGISIMPYSYSANAYSGVRFIKIPFETDLYIYWRKDDNSPVLRNILQILKEGKG